MRCQKRKKVEPKVGTGERHKAYETTQHSLEEVWDFKNGAKAAQCFQTDIQKSGLATCFVVATAANDTSFHFSS